MFKRSKKRKEKRQQPAGDAAAVAHVLRRCSFAADPAEIDRWTPRGPQELVESLLANDRIHALTEDEVLAPFGGDLEDVDDDEVLTAFFDQLMSGENQLHERLVWFWHTHFTTSFESSAIALVWIQHQLVRRMAFGSFVDLAKAMTVDAAMLLYLDGAGSYGDNPNENYAREFLELFTLGRNAGYTEEDVRAAARIFSGWHVDWEDGSVSFDPDTHYSRPVTFMGQRRRWNMDSLIEFVCEQPACHRHIARQLYQYFVGAELGDDRADELAAVFVEHDLQIKPLLAEILRGQDFLDARYERVRQPLEWLTGAMHAVGFDTVADAGGQYWHIDVLGQVPFRPPNVAGWPFDDRWASTSQIVARTGVLLDWELPASTIDQVEPTVDSVLHRCGIVDPSTSTRDALDAIESAVSEFDYRLELLFVTALTSPEFTLL